MNMKRTGLILLGTGFLLAACVQKPPVDAAQPTPAIAEEQIAIALTEAPTAAPTPAPTPTPTATPAPTDTPTPEPTDTPAPTPDGLLGGEYDGFIEGEPVLSEWRYQSERVSVEVTRYDSSPLAKHLVYYVTDIHVQDIEALRTASWDGKFSARGKKPWAKVERMAQAEDAIVAINGDYYTYHEKTGLVIRNGERFEPDPWKPWKGHQILLLYRDGSAEVFESDSFDPLATDLSNVWQAWEFGPNFLDENGKALSTFDKSYNDIARANPRTVFGYYGPGHYCFVTVDGRKKGTTDGLTLAETAQLMESLGCVIAFNLDGGQTTQLYWNGAIANEPFRGGRSTSDIICIVEPQPAGADPVE